MKKIILPLLLITAVSYSGPKHYSGANTAEVNQEQGIYIFTDSKPIQIYEYLGTVKNGMIQTPTDITGAPKLGTICDPTYNQLKGSLIKQAKKKYKDFSAIIINGGAMTGDVIKFKE